MLFETRNLKLLSITEPDSEISYAYKKKTCKGIFHPTTQIHQFWLISGRVGEPKNF